MGQYHERYTFITCCLQANKLLEAKIDMLRANLQAARTHADASGGDDGAELQKLKSDLSKATRQISELEETTALFKDQQSASLQAAAALQAEVCCLDPDPNKHSQVRDGIHRSK